jgi:hypothetical protein
MRILHLAFVVLALASARGRQDSPDIGPNFPFFPADNPWRWDVSGHAVHPLSDTYVNSIGAGGHLQIDLSFRFNAVTNATPLKPIDYTLYPDESDPGPGFGSPPGGATSGMWPIPNGALLEEPSDSHLIIVNTDTNMLYEAWMGVPPSGGGNWSAANGCVFDLASNNLRPDGWTSGDAAGLPILPGLLRWEEVAAGAINHALRFTVVSSQNTHLYPARHHAGSANVTRPPMGLRMRLKAGYDISGFSPQAQTILACLKKHGMLCADNGSNWFISGVIDSAFPSNVLDEIKTVPGSAMEAVETVDSLGNPIPPSGGGGGGGGNPPPTGDGGGSKKKRRCFLGAEGEAAWLALALLGVAAAMLVRR